jgi:hypothetical protein
MIVPWEVLHGKVVKILDEYRVVVDIGYIHGIKKDMKFFIYEYGEEILDPTTHKVIDRIERVKHRLKVTHIQEKFSIMKSDEYDYLGSSFFMRPQPEYKISKLSTESSLPTSPDRNFKIIRIGDLVRQDVT